jgi:hypothetical protein
MNGKVLTMAFQITESYSSSPASLSVSLPFGTGISSQVQYCSGRNDSDGTQLQGFVAGSGTVMTLLQVNNTLPPSGKVLVMGPCQVFIQ